MKHILLFCALIVLVCLQSTTMATSLGISGSYNSLHGTVTYKTEESFAEKYDATISHKALGLFLLTEIDTAKLFSYRLNANIYFFNNEYTLKQASASTIQLKGAGIEIINSVGLNILRFDFFLLWAGPTIGLGYGLSNTIKTQTESTRTTNQGSYQEYLIYAAGTIGVSFFLFDLIGLEVCGGYRAMPFSSFLDTDNGNNSYQIYGIPYGPYIEVGFSLKIN